MSFTIQRAHPILPEPAPRPLAQPSSRWGAAAPVRVYVAENAMAAVWAAVGGPAPGGDARPYGVMVERGGALAGRYHADPSGQRFIVITEALPAAAAPASAAHIDIRTEDWVEIHAAIARRGDVRLLGWYHSHPGLSVRMSYVDRLTQRRTFGVDWQVGLVVDPWSGRFRFHIGPHARRARWVAFIGDEAAR